MKTLASGTGKPPKVRRYTVSGDPDSKARLLKCISHMFLQAKEVAALFAAEAGQTLHYSPANFLRVFVAYRKLLKERQEIVKDISQRYEAGLDQINETQDAIFHYHAELASKAPALAEKYDSAGGVLEQIEEEFSRIAA